MKCGRLLVFGLWSPMLGRCCVILPRDLLVLFVTVAALAAPVATSVRGLERAQDGALRERAQAALRKAVEFYRTKVATEGGYHFAYAEDLSYGRSEMSEGPTRVEIQRDGTPLVGMAYLDAYHATGDPYYRDAARDVARVLVKGQYCSGGWDYYIEFDPQKRAQYPYRADGRYGYCARRSEEHTSELQSRLHLVCRLLLDKKKLIQL